MNELHKYHIRGMSCDGCRSNVEKALNSLSGVIAVVKLNPPIAEVSMAETISLVQFNKVLKQAGNYTMEPHGDEMDLTEAFAPSLKLSSPMEPSELKANAEAGTFYCPMHCEGEKIYRKPGNCPICGMHLVKLATADPAKGSYTCSKHPEIISEEAGNCSICGATLVLRIQEDDETKNYRDLLLMMKIAVVFTLPVFAIAMIDMMPNNPLLRIMDSVKWNWVQFILSIPVVFYACWMFFIRAWASILSRNLNMFTLIGIGTGIAFIFSIVGLLFPSIFPSEFKNEEGAVMLYFEATTVILTLVLLGQLLEARAHSRTNLAIKELLKLAPTEATLIVNGIETIVSMDRIKKGDLLRIKPGDKIPVDGIISVGSSNIDESMITGEPMPIEKREGDKIVSGTLNGNKSFIMKAEKVGSETLLSQIVNMVNEASRSKAPIQKLADRIAKYFVPIVIASSIITFFVWVAFGPEPAYVYALINAIAVLIIACPCALGLATPMSVMVGVGRGAQAGVLIKNAEVLQSMSKVDVVIMDKTGTITEGKPTLEKLFVFNGSEDLLLQLIASLNQFSEHPLAIAILNYAKLKDAKLLEVKDFESILGEGVIGTVNSNRMALGNRKLMDTIKANIPMELEREIIANQKLAKTVSYIAINEKVVGFLSIYDPIKASSRTAINELQRQGLEVIILSGDNEHTVGAVAKALNINSYKAACMPIDKLNEIKRLQALGKIVAMAGDGINDAPALAQADIGIAMGTGTDVAIESAKITLLKGDIMGIVKAKKLSHKVMLNIKQNLFFAFLYNILGVPIAAGILYPFFGILLSPMIAAVSMSFSSVSVIVNALRLRSLKL